MKPGAPRKPRQTTKQEAAAPRLAPPKATAWCPCIAYEPADGEEGTACHCGHSPEDHCGDYCEGEVGADG